MKIKPLWVYLWALLSLGLSCQKLSPSRGDQNDALRVEAPQNNLDEKQKTAQGKIALTSLFAAEVALAFGPQAQEKVGAIPQLVDNPEFSPIAGQWPRSVLRFNESVEAIVYLNPSLVVIATFHSANLTYLLEKAEIPYAVLRPMTGFSSYMENIDIIAGALEMPQSGEALKGRFQSRLASIEKHGGQVEQPYTVISYMAGSTAGLETCFHDIAKAAGLRNLSAEKGVTGHRHLETEEIIVWNPDAIAISCSASCDTALELFLQLPGIGAVEAVKNKRVAAIPSHIFSSSGENMLLFAEMLQQQIYFKE